MSRCSARLLFSGERRLAFSLASVRHLGFWLGVLLLFGLPGTAVARDSVNSDVPTASVRCKTDWMYRGMVGLSTHYFPLTVASVESVADAFDVQRVANQATEAGSAWFVFTLQHQNWLMMAPNGTFDRFVGHGDRTPERDVPLELFRALDAKGIKLLLYVNLYMSAAPAVTQAMGGWPPNDQLVDRMAAVYREFSIRYGDKVAGWWVDGAGMPHYRNSPHRERWFAKIAGALRAGNPNAVVAISPALEVGRYSVDSDFTAGESNDLKPIPAGRWLDGAQWHLWTYLGGWWGSNGKRFSDQELGKYLALVTSRGGAITLDVGTWGVVRDGLKGDTAAVSEGGRIDPEQIVQIKRVREQHRLRSPSLSEPVPACPAH